MQISSRLSLASLLAVVILAGHRAGAAPRLEAIEVAREIALPAGVTLKERFGAVELMPDGEHVLLGVRAPDGTTQQAVMRLDGSEYRCLTCGKLAAAPLAEPFEDGRRLWVKTEGDDVVGGGLGAPEPGVFVVECRPSLARCDRYTALPVRFPHGRLHGVQNIRASGPSRDGHYAKWTEIRALDGTVMVLGRLERRDDGYELVDPRVLNPPYARTDEAASWAAGARSFESKGFDASGRRFYYYAQSSALAPDLFELDLATGTHRQLTHELAYNELVEPSPDGGRLAYTSARGLGRSEVLSALPRPALLDMATSAQLIRVALWGNRSCLNARWLMASDAAASSGYGGQPVILEDEWFVRDWSWFPDGTQALISEERIKPGASSGAQPLAQRVRVLRFPARRPVSRPPIVELASLDLAAATAPYAGYHGIAAKPVIGRVVRGARGGDAILTYSGIFAAGRWEVLYRDYTDDGLRFVNGTEALTTGLASALATWTAALTVRGASRGYLSADLSILGAAADTDGVPTLGWVDSEVDGKRRSGLPRQPSCPGFRRPPLTVAAVARAARPDGTIEVIATVTARVADDPVARPVAAARVTVGDATAYTDADGIARLAIAPTAARQVRAEAGGFAPASVALP